MVTTIRDPHDRPKPNIRLNTSRLRLLQLRRDLRQKLRHATGLSLSNWLPRLASTSHRRRINGRYLDSQAARLHDRCLGHVRHLCPSTGSYGRWIRLLC